MRCEEARRDGPSVAVTERNRLPTVWVYDFARRIYGAVIRVVRKRFAVTANLVTKVICPIVPAIRNDCFGGKPPQALGRRRVLCGKVRIVSKLPHETRGDFDLFRKRESVRVKHRVAHRLGLSRATVLRLRLAHKGFGNATHGASVVSSPSVVHCINRYREETGTHRRPWFMLLDLASRSVEGYVDPTVGQARRKRRRGRRCGDAMKPLRCKSQGKNSALC